jgi:AcrR family transcriptional regulator
VDDTRQRLLDRVIVEAAANGLADRSLRDIAAAVGSSHRMLHYHFGSRAGLVTAIVHQVEANQRTLLAELALSATDPSDLVLALWARLSAPAMMPYVRLFFECVAATAGSGLTDPWLRSGRSVATAIGADVDLVDLQLGVAVIRGLLIDVLAGGDARPSTAALHRFVAMWRQG